MEDEKRWRVDGRRAETPLTAQALDENAVALDGQAARYFNPDGRAQRRLLLYYDGREFPAYVENAQTPAVLSWSKALTSRLIGVFPDYQDYFKSHADVPESEQARLRFDRADTDAFALRAVLPWNGGLALKQDFLEHIGAAGAGAPADSTAIAFARALLETMDNRGYADVFMTAARLQKNLSGRDEDPRAPFEIGTAPLDAVASHLMQGPYAAMAAHGFLQIEKKDEHFYFRVVPELLAELSTDDRRYLIKRLDDSLDAYYARLSAPSLTQSLATFMNDYAAYYGKDFRYSFKDVILQDIPAGLEQLEAVRRGGYRVKGWAGREDWAAVPYVALTDPARVPYEDGGLSVRLMLDKDEAVLCLALVQGSEPVRDALRAQGVSETAEALGDAFARTAAAYRGALGTTQTEPAELPDPLLAKSVIFSTRYESAPTEETLGRDLADMLALYTRALDADIAPVTRAPEPEPTEEPVENEVPEAQSAPEETDDNDKEEHATEPKADVPAGRKPEPNVEILRDEPPVSVRALYGVARPKKKQTLRAVKKHPDYIISAAALSSVQDALTPAAPGKRVRLQSVRRLPQPVEYVEPENTGTVLEQVEQSIAAGGYTPASGLVKNVYLSLKTYPLVALTGSGVDQFVRAYTTALGATFENGRFLQTRVKNLRDTADKMFGAYNPYAGAFREGALTEFILRAVEEPDAPFFIYLKDAPLSAREDFLGELTALYDTRRRCHGEIITDPVLGADAFGADEEACSRYNGLYLPDNLFVLAELAKAPYDAHALGLLGHLSLIRVAADGLTLREAEAPQPVLYGSQFLHGDLLTLAENADEKDMIRDVVVLLEAINGVLARIGAAIGPRERDEICLYLLYNAQEDLLSQDAALDLAIAQKILPRIYGTGAPVAAVLNDLFKICAGTREADAVKTYTDGGLFPKSAGLLAAMAARLERGETASVLG